MIFILIILFLCFINIRNFAKLLYPVKYSEYVWQYSSKYNIDPYLVLAVIKAESNFNPEAKSNKKAHGLMQIMPDTGKWIAEKTAVEGFKEEMLLEPELNIKMGCWYIDNLSKEFNRDTDLVLAAYNGGRGNVKKWLNNRKYSYDGEKLDNIPFKETDEYVKRVKTNYRIYLKLYKP